ncbi:MAG: outer membrane protein assembly factor BamD [Flammeovirgaceae bacterium]|nr:MAG: outer membrane protein assembly factor BamD [Flammeovirgaceae bacterium]
MRLITVVFAVSILLLGTSCGKFRKIEKNPDWRVKYEASLAYYAKKDYYRASVLLEQIMPVIRGLPEAERAQFNLAYCQYYQKMYLLASEQFRTFYETYGRSALAEEGRYMYAYSLYKSSPDSNLDQTESVQAMTSMQEFLNRYPASKFRDQALEVIFTIQARLEEKGFANARQYYKLRNYKAAIVALGNFINNFPDSKYVEEAHFLIVASHYLLAEQSIQSKQKERYQSVVNDYIEFLDRYPNSSYLKEAERYYVDSLDKLGKLKS